jgi:hypothetical protein
MRKGGIVWTDDVGGMANTYSCTLELTATFRKSYLKTIRNTSSRVNEGQQLGMRLAMLNGNNVSGHRRGGMGG